MRLLKIIFPLCFALLTGLNSEAFNRKKNHKIFISNLPPWLVTQGNVCISGPICDLLNKLTQPEKSTFVYEATGLARANLSFFEGRQSIGLFPKMDDMNDKYHLMKKVFHYKSGILRIKNRKRNHRETAAATCSTHKNPHQQANTSYIEVSTLEQCIMMLNSNRTQAILITELEYNSKSFAFNKIKTLEFLPQTNHSLWLHLNKKFKPTSPEYRFVKNTLSKIDTQSILLAYLKKRK